MRPTKRDRVHQDQLLQEAQTASWFAGWLVLSEGIDPEIKAQAKAYLDGGHYPVHARDGKLLPGDAPRLKVVAS